MVGIAPAKKLKQSVYLKQWIREDRHGAMNWMARNFEKRMDVKRLYPEAKSVIAVAHNYYTPYQHSDKTQKAKISRYAWGSDYHRIMKKKLKIMLKRIKEVDAEIEGRLAVDTAPIQDKLWAQEAGIGWQGKNTNILTKDYGSWVFLGELIINKPLTYDDPGEDHCGTCTACIEACPTDALQPYKIDATRCISYLTIEHRDKPLPEPFKDKLHGWVFGCDICQDVCPWNRFARESDEPGYHPHAGNVAPSLQSLGEMTPEEFKRRFKKSPVYRARYENFMRNVKAIKESTPGE